MTAIRLFKVIYSCEVTMWWSSNSISTRFELRTFSSDSKVDECFKRFVVEREFVKKSLLYDWFHMDRKPESSSNLFFSSIFNLSYKLQLLNVQHIVAQRCVKLY